MNSLANYTYVTYKYGYGKISRTYLQGLHKCNLPETQVFSGNLETTVKMPVLYNHRLIESLHVMVVSSGKAVVNQASVRKPVTVLKDNVFATRSYSLYLNINKGKMKVGL